MTTLNISHDQAWIMERITRRYGYNGSGFRLTKSSGNNIVISYTAPNDDGMYESHTIEVNDVAGVEEFIIIPSSALPEDQPIRLSARDFFERLES